MPAARNEVRRSEGVSPREFGWQASSVRNALVDEPLGLITKKGPQGGTINLCKFKPLKGELVGMALAAATPTPERDIFSRGILADWRLFQDAQREQQRIDRGEIDANRRTSKVALEKRHTEDPDIGDSMKQFSAGYVDSWIRALGDNNVALQKAFKPLIIVNGTYFPQAYVHDNEHSHERENVGGHFYHHDLHYNLIAQYRESIPGNLMGYFQEFHREEFFRFVDWLKDTFPDKDLLRTAVYKRIINSDRTDVLDMVPFDSSYVNVHQGDNRSHSWGSSDTKWPTYTMTDSEIVLYDADTRATIELEKTHDRARPFSIVGGHVSFIDTTNALSPAVAWKSTVHPDSGKVERTFLTRDEMNHHFGSEFRREVLDDWLGLVTLVGFLPLVRKDIPSHVHLQDEGVYVRKEEGQRMGPAQIAVYLNDPNKRRLIAQDKDNVLASIEELHYG